MGMPFHAGGSCDVALQELLVDLLRKPIYKATMGIGGHKDICWVRQLDDNTLGHLGMCGLFSWQCSRQFIHSDCVTIVEQVVMSIVEQQVRAIHTQQACDIWHKNIPDMWNARTLDAIDGTVSTGKQPGQKTPNIGENVDQNSWIKSTKWMYCICFSTILTYFSQTLMYILFFVWFLYKENSRME